MQGQVECFFYKPDAERSTPSSLILKRRDFGSQLNRDQLGKEFSMCVKRKKRKGGSAIVEAEEEEFVASGWVELVAGGHPGVGQVVPYQPGNGRQGAE